MARNWKGTTATHNYQPVFHDLSAYVLKFTKVSLDASAILSYLSLR